MNETPTAPWMRTPTSWTPGGIAETKAIDGSRCRSAAGLLTEWSSVLGFPDYFGHNWMALADCLHDIRYTAADPVTIVLRSAGQLLVDESPDVLAAFLSVFGDVATADTDDPPLLLVIDDTPDQLADLTRRASEAGHTVTPS